MDEPLPHGTDAARRSHLAHGEELCNPCRSLDSPYVWADPARKSGRPCVGGTRIPTGMVADLVWDHPSGVDLAPESWPSLTRPRVLVACWYEAIHGTPVWRRRWGAWAEQAGRVMWHAGTCDYSAIPDPPSNEEEVSRRG